MVVKYGPHGKFLGCPGFPECRNTKPYLEKIGVACPKCGKEVVMRKTKKGRRYFGCEDKDGNIMDAKTIRNAISCPGRNRLPGNARSAAAICWKKAISWCAVMKTAAM